MNADIGAALVEWHDFFSTVAGVAGTLVGLLFVALGLSPAIMADDSPAGLRIWSAQTFHTFLVLLVLGIAGLVPDDDGKTLAGALVVLGGQGIVRVILDMRRVRTDPDPNWGRRALLRFASPAAAYVFCLWLAFTLWQGDVDALGWLVAIVFFLTISAAASCWDLLKAVGDLHREGRADAAG